MTKSAAAEGRISLRGTVEAVFYSGPTFTAGRLRTAEGGFISFAGKVFARPGDAVVLEGQWTRHPKYGRQFAAEVLGYDLELDADGLANYLANHPDVKSIGPAKARLIADHFGAGFDAAIRARPEAVAAVAKAPLDSILALQRIWIANSDFNAAMTYLARFGFRCCRMAEWTCSEPSTGSPRTSTAAAGVGRHGRLASAPRSRRPRWILLQTWAWPPPPVHPWIRIALWSWCAPASSWRMPRRPNGRSAARPAN